MKDSVLINESVVQRSSFVNVVITVVTFIVKTLLPNIHVDNYLFDFFFGVCLTYIIDIMFVQQRFNKNNAYVCIPYTDYYYRLKYMFKISVFYKFLVVIVIGSLINRSLYKFVINILDKYRLFQREEHQYYRDLVINTVINFFLTLMLLNFLKFKWAYVDSDDSYSSLIILSLFSLAILISVTK
tara:strand:+ start:1275 stop:1826 length:552 start_codon:yes stop_codon:yes gene_type:complete